MSGARPDTWMPLYWGDYRRDTAHLGAAEHGAYLLLIGHYWTSGKPLPDDDKQLARIASMTSQEWRKARSTIAAFFDLTTAGVWRHKRIEAEMARCQGVSSERSKAGAVGAANRWRGHSKTDGKRMANAMANECYPQPQPQPQEKPSQQPDPLVAAGNRCCEAAGLDPGRLANDFAVVGRWLHQFDLEADILPAIRGVAARGHRGNSLNYFTNAIAEFHATRTAPVPIRPAAPAAKPPAAPYRGIAIGSPEDLAQRRAMGLEP